jgi:hypothetical protein
VTSETDLYLDELFDRLGGTGGAGRRALTEAEDHLRAAVAEGIASGLSQERAEHDAVARFGPAARIAGQLRRVHRRFWLTTLSSAWLLAGIGLIALSSSYLAAAVLRWSLPQPRLPLCGQAFPAVTGGYACTPTAMPNGSIVHETAFAGVAILFFAAIILLVRRWAIRSVLVPPAYRRFAGVAGTLFFLASLYLFVRPDAPFIIDQGVGAQVSTVDTLVFLLGSIVVGVWGVARGVRAHRTRPAQPSR